MPKASEMLVVVMLEEVVVVVVLVPLVELVESLGWGLACRKAEVSIWVCRLGCQSEPHFFPIVKRSPRFLFLEL